MDSDLRITQDLLDLRVLHGLLHLPLVRRAAHAPAMILQLSHRPFHSSHSLEHSPRSLQNAWITGPAVWLRRIAFTSVRRCGGQVTQTFARGESDAHDGRVHLRVEHVANAWARVGPRLAIVGAAGGARVAITEAFSLARSPCLRY